MLIHVRWGRVAHKLAICKSPVIYVDSHNNSYTEPVLFGGLKSPLRDPVLRSRICFLIHSADHPHAANISFVTNHGQQGYGSSVLFSGSRSGWRGRRRGMVASGRSGRTKASVVSMSREG